ncbi:MAG: hypothetical protein IPG58_13615 [Acidobacteria bacterium]|nr:hypothetical protein [Acidobacteriota bacterium]
MFASSDATLVGNVTLGDGNVTATSLALNTGAVLAVSGNTLTLNGVSLSGAGTLSGAGLVRMQATSTLNAGGTYTAPFEINSGTTTGSGTLGGPLTILSGATLNTSNQSFILDGDLTINAGGTATKTSNTFSAGGANIVNNGTITGGFNFTAVGNSESLRIRHADGSDNDPRRFDHNSDERRNLWEWYCRDLSRIEHRRYSCRRGQYVDGQRSQHFRRRCFYQYRRRKLRTQGTTSVNVGAAFAGSLEVNNGTLTGSGTVSGSLTVLSGATLNTTNQSFIVNGDLTNNGTITKSSNTFTAGGANILNNGTITGGSLNFSRAGTQILSGTGSISSAATILAGSTVALGSNHQLTSLSVSTGGTLNTATFMLFLNGAGTPLAGAGTMLNINITHNGGAAQTVQTAANVTYNQLGIENAAGVTLPAAKPLLRD